MGSMFKIRDDFTSFVWAFMPVAIAMNIVIGQIVSMLKLPVYLDTIGTIMMGALCGPWVGLLTGALSNLIWGIFAPGALPFIPVAAWIGLVAGICGRMGWFSTWYMTIVSGFLIAVTTPFIATPIVVYVYGGVEGSGASLITAVLIKSGHKVTSAAFYKNMMIEPLDKIPSAFVSFLILLRVPDSFRQRFPMLSRNS